MRSAIRIAGWTIVGVVALAVCVLAVRIGRSMLSPMDVPPQVAESMERDPTISVTITESYLNRRLAQALAQEDDYALKKVYVDLQPARQLSIIMEAETEVGALALFPKGTIVATVSDGDDGPFVSIVRLEAAGVTVPERAWPAPAHDIVAELNTSIQTAIGRQGLGIRHLETSQEAITVELVLEDTLGDGK